MEQNNTFGTKGVKQRGRPAGVRETRPRAPREHRTVQKNSVTLAGDLDAFVRREARRAEQTSTEWVIGLIRARMTARDQARLGAV